MCHSCQSHGTCLKDFCQIFSHSPLQQHRISSWLLVRLRVSPLVSYMCLGSLLNTLIDQICRDMHRHTDIIKIMKHVGVDWKTVKEWSFFCLLVSVSLTPVYSSALSACLFSTILQLTIFLSPFQNRSINTRPLFSQASFFLSPSCVFVSVLLSLSFSTLSPPSANSHPSLPLSRTNKQCSKLRHEGWLSAQRVQLVSISRQGGKDDRERCWNEGSVRAPSLFNLSY